MPGGGPLFRRQPSTGTALQGAVPGHATPGKSGLIRRLYQLTEPLLGLFATFGPVLKRWHTELSYVSDSFFGGRLLQHPYRALQTRARQGLPQTLCQ